VTGNDELYACGKETVNACKETVNASGWHVSSVSMTFVETWSASGWPVFVANKTFGETENVCDVGSGIFFWAFT
jgi:hypothetical protein